MQVLLTMISTEICRKFLGQELPDSDVEAIRDVLYVMAEKLVNDQFTLRLLSDGVEDVQFADTLASHVNGTSEVRRYT